jgi:two-component sensor histidine kinase
VQFGESHETLRALKSRVEALTLLETQLYAEQEVEWVDLGRYLMELLGNLVRFHGEYAANVRLDAKIAGVTVKPNTAKDVGLLSSEFVMNSFKHAFPSGEGTLSATLEHEGEVASLILADDGPGFPQGAPTNGLGLRLIHALAQRIDGSLKIEGENGARLTLTFPVR